MATKPTRQTGPPEIGARRIAVLRLLCRSRSPAMTLPELSKAVGATSSHTMTAEAVRSLVAAGHVEVQDTGSGGWHVPAFRRKGVPA